MSAVVWRFEDITCSKNVLSYGILPNSWGFFCGYTPLKGCLFFSLNGKVSAANLLLFMLKLADSDTSLALGNTPSPLLDPGYMYVISQFQVTLGFPDIQPLNVHTLFRPFSHPFPISIPASNLLTYQIHVKVFVKFFFYPLCKEIIHPHFEKINIIQNGWLQSRMCGHISPW